MARDEQLGGQRLSKQIDTLPSIFRKGALYVGKHLLGEAADEDKAITGRPVVLSQAESSHVESNQVEAAGEDTMRGRQLRYILEWAEALRKEAEEDAAAAADGGSERGVSAWPDSRVSPCSFILNDREVRSVLRAIWEQLHQAESLTACPWM